MISFSILGFLSHMENCASFMLAAVVSAKPTKPSFYACKITTPYTKNISNIKYLRYIKYVVFKYKIST